MGRKARGGRPRLPVINAGVYRSVLRVREARAFDFGCFLMRLYAYMMTIGTVTMLTLAGYPFFTAGLSSSVIALSTFFISPRVSKLIDERGQSRVVPMAAVITLLGLVFMLVTAQMHGPEWLLLACAVVMGFNPNPQALARSRWTYLIRSGRLGANAPELRTMFSYEGVLDDIGFMFGPALSIAIAAATVPIAGMAAGGALFVLGVVVLCASRSTEPVPGWVPAQAEHAEGDAEGAAETPAEAAPPPSVPRREKSLIRTSPMVRVLFVLMVFLGGMFGVLDTGTVSFAGDIGNSGFASVVLMTSGFVSMLMGFLFGMVALRIPQHVQLVVFASAAGCAYGTMLLIDSAASMLAVNLLGALTYAPFLIVANATCERCVPGARITEAITWINAGVTCGLAFGPTLAGYIIDTWGTIACFDFGAALALAIPATVLLCFRIIKRSVNDAPSTA